MVSRKTLRPSSIERHSLDTYRSRQFWRDHLCLEARYQTSDPCMDEDKIMSAKVYIRSSGNSNDNGPPEPTLFTYRISSAVRIARFVNLPTYLWMTPLLCKNCTPQITWAAYKQALDWSKRPHRWRWNITSPPHRYSITKYRWLWKEK